MTMDLSKLQQQLFDLCQYDETEENYKVWNTLLWDRIHGIKSANALNNAIMQLRKANYD